MLGGVIVIEILPLEKCDCSFIVEWNKEKTADFLQQWAGRGYEFPISENQISSRIDTGTVADFIIYKIVLDNEIIGTIELMNIDKAKGTANIGRFLLNPFFAGRGYGTIALKEFVTKTFEKYNFAKLRLTVFDFNKSAFRCYEKTGFKVSRKETRPNGWIAIRMEIDNPTA